MTEFDTLPPHLQRLGRELVVAAERLHGARSGRRRWWRSPSSRGAAGLVIAAFAIPSAAIAATQLISTDQVAASLPQGARSFIGTDPHCTVVRVNVEYHCVLAKAPNDDGAPDAASGYGSRSPAGHVLATAIEPHGTHVYVKAPTLTALKREILAAHLTHVVVVEGRSRRRLADDDTDTARSATHWEGTVEETVDATNHVNGGCRALTVAGTDWECYIGEAAVQQRIISQDFLGEYAPGPSQG
jgi:hypothetical protein